LALVPVLDPANPNDYFLFVTNDFITQNGFQAGAAYKDASGVDVDTMDLGLPHHTAGTAEIGFALTI
jgi:hypothetical protein